MGLACARAIQKIAGTAPRKEGALRADIYAEALRACRWQALRIN